MGRRETARDQERHAAAAPPPRPAATARGGEVLAELARRRTVAEARRVVRGVWAITPHLYAVSAKPDLIGNGARAVAEGLRALAPPPP